jgi:hypothetical protein
MDSNADTFAYLATLYAVDEEDGVVQRRRLNSFAHLEYDQTSKFAERALAADHPDRLWLAVKFSTFLSDVYRIKLNASMRAQNAYTAASSLEKEARGGRGKEEMCGESDYLIGLLWILSAY